jgi:hypothetical protein
VVHGCHGAGAVEDEGDFGGLLIHVLVLLVIECWMI